MGGVTNGVVKTLMIGHALTGYDQILFLVGETNLRSRCALEKIGSVLTDRMSTVDTSLGAVRQIIFAIDADCFAAGLLAARSSAKAG